VVILSLRTFSLPQHVLQFDRIVFFFAFYRTEGYPAKKLLLFDSVVVFVKDLIPLYAIILFTSKNKQANQTQRSTATGGSNHPYQRINDTAPTGV
jgi:hypothetical protein